MELWDTQKLRDALHVLADDPAVQEAARVSHLDGIINAAQVASSEAARSGGGKRGEKSPPPQQRRPFWAKLRTEIDDIITTTRDRAVALAAASVARRLSALEAGGDGVPSAVNSSTDADDWAELVGEWCSGKFAICRCL